MSAFHDSNPVDQDALQYLKKMQSSIEVNLSKLEAEFANLKQHKGQNRAEQKPHAQKSQVVTSETGHAPHWDQVIQFVQKGQQEEAVYSLVRVVQRLLDEKATKKTLNEKANKTYVDSLFGTISNSMSTNLEASTTGSLETLNERIAGLHAKIQSVRQYMETELRDIEASIQNLTRPDEAKSK
ncbi:hypothetical protein TVAG_150760 [Trichomonas vaginalis G3]|uniref:Uncharacterized protein n=1 Tax=Trichomonas vaginalis (strain ATCC PRA-98 / G3) TaxID=412133 RepID=A2DRX7_TRIV3|nr:hypothetical protein TVAGG3_0978360 [Trichomonas vaginalis G3]EAY16924.1 hypothetical protein TVAG_150760 [Trichomonas vaginalis G3]KAI5489090.1 hypothetical protein TVAGG3_0978360 [Trichomonas vaginalis G3]|eukprot:XP_001329147.1 hypothetical protein [Trichomonas vaginalis G3]